MTDGCVFCRVVARESPADIVYEDEEVLAFKDLYPKAPVHLLIVPKRPETLRSRFSGATTVETQAPTAERHHVQQAARDRDVLKEVDELVLITQMVVEERGGHESEDSEDTGDNASAIAERKHDATDNLDESGEAECYRWQRQSDGLDVTDGHRRCGDL